METKLFLSLLLILLIPLTVAEYHANNAFTQGDEIDVYTGNCTYQNHSEMDSYTDCDDSIECRMTAFFPNGTLMESYRECSRIGNQFNYSFGFINDTGTYNARAFLSGEKGWTTKDFEFTISAASAPPADTDVRSSGGSGGAITQPQEEFVPETVEEGPEEETWTDKVKQIFINIGGFFNEEHALFIGVMVFIAAILIVWYLWNKYEDSIKKLQKEETPRERRVPMRT